MDVGRIRADLSGATGRMGEGRSSSDLPAAVLGCRRGWRWEARESCPVVWCLGVRTSSSLGLLLCCPGGYCGGIGVGFSGVKQEASLCGVDG